MILPQDLAPVLPPFAIVFSQPTWLRFQLLMASALLTTGRRTVANLLRTLGPLAQGHPTTYQRVFSAAAWSGVQLACVLVRLLLQLLPEGPVRLVGDDTVDGHPGRQVYGKARHRDPVRSSKTYTAWRYGHKWVVLALLVRFPWATRDWALPVLVDLYLSPEQNRQRNRPHRTPAQLLCRLVRLLLLRFPDRRFLLIGDSGYGSHEVARFVRRHAPRLHLVSKFHPEANLFLPPPPYTGTGRPRVKGDPLLKPKDSVAQATERLGLTVDWYGGGSRQVEAVTGTGHWYKSGHGLVAVRWVYVHDTTGTHRDEYLYTTDLSLTPQQVISAYTARWNIETTFQELRSYLGLETTQGWCQKTVLRLAPCLFGLYSVVALVYQQLPPEGRGCVITWPGKPGVTFSDALTCVRRWLWREWVFRQAGGDDLLEKLPPTLKETLFTALAPTC
jgi:hypothetical protein